MRRGLRVATLREGPRFPGAPDSPPFEGTEVPLGTLETTLGRDARVDLLARHASRMSADPGARIVLNVAVSDEYGHLERLLLDPIRVALRKAGAPIAEPGERLDREGRRVMHFFSEADLSVELALAGLEVESRAGTRFVVRRAAPSHIRGVAQPSIAPSMVADVLAALPKVEWALRARSPKELFTYARSLGRSAPTRSDREAHRRVIAWVDGLVPGATGCYRRTALELATSPEAAAEDVLMGLDVGRTGHAWLASDPRARAYDVVFRLSP
ncbi:MAG: hypothetical protein U0174_09650 [Polyangiaceae bacterium]